MQKFFRDAKQQNLEDEDEEKTLDIADDPCIIPDIKNYLEPPSDIINFEQICDYIMAFIILF